MKQISVLIAVLLGLVMVSPATGQEQPEPIGFVSDFAAIIDPDIAVRLEDALRLLEEETSVELVVVTVPELGGSPIEDYAVRLFESWEIGKKGTDSGILLLVSRDDGWVHIEVGYGMEPYLTDGQAGRILDAEFLPFYNSGDYSQAITNTTYAIAKSVIDNGYQPVPSPGTSQSDEGAVARLAKFWWLLFPMGALGIYAISFMARSREVIFGALWGTAIGAVFGWVVASWLGGIVGALCLGLLGLLVDIALSSAYKYQVGSGIGTAWHRSWGGFYGLGGKGGGGRGFGGFGGGRSGGGGASRRGQ